MKCRDFTTEIGCWSRADGTQENVIIHNTYGLNDQGVEIISGIRYLNAQGDVITIPTGDTVTIGACVVEKELVLETGNFTANETIAAGFVAATIQVSTGELLVNGATVTSCTPYVLENMSFGGQKCTYPQVTVTTNEPGTEYTMIVQRCP